MTKQMPEKLYKEFRLLLYDFQGFNRDIVVYAMSGPEHDHRIKMAKHIESFEKKYGSANHILVRPENREDWSWYNEINKTGYHM